MLDQTFNELRLEQHPDKTLIGRIERGFDFLGYHFELVGLSVAVKTIERFRERITRLYEQGADLVRIGQYVLKWHQWVNTEFIWFAGRLYDPIFPPVSSMLARWDTFATVSIPYQILMAKASG